MAVSASRFRATLRVAGLYLGLMLVMNLLWEIVHLPLYSIWKHGTPWRQAAAVLHCTAGDVLIAGTALVVSVIVVGRNDWPAQHSRRVALLATTLGIAYTAFSEWLHVHQLRSWSYSELMPEFSLAGREIGLSPLLQWTILPPLCFAIVQIAISARGIGAKKSPG
jgi:hypothetical protein